MNQNLIDRFGGISRIFGEKGLQKINSSRVLVVGLGGVGSWSVEALARSGVGTLVLCDFDDICVSNTNRQLHALDGEIGKQKTLALKDRVKKINPEIQVEVFDEPFGLENQHKIFEMKYDCVIDAIDHAHTKLFLAKACQNKQVPEVVVGSAGGRMDPTKIQCTDLSKASEDPLLSILRKDLRRQAGFPRKGKMGIDCVYSLEKPLYPVGCDEFTREKPESFKKPLDCSTGFGTLTHITGTFGFMAAHACLQSLQKD